jgi:hypothetical protein
VIEAAIDAPIVAQNALLPMNPGRAVARAVRLFVPDTWRELFSSSFAYDAELAKHVGSRYSRELVTELLDDNAFTTARGRRGDAAAAVAAEMPWLFRFKPSAKWFLPRALHKDRELLSRVKRVIAIGSEAYKFAQEQGIRTEADEWNLIPNLMATTPRHERRSATPWFVGDPGVPVAIADRYMAAYVSFTTADLVRKAARLNAWPLEDLQRAVIEWTTTYEYALVLIASLPGAHIPSLMNHEPMDLAALVDRHNERRRIVAGMAADAFDRIKNSQ